MASSDRDGGASSSGQTKRLRLSQDTSKHLVGYRQSWESEFTWLVPVETDGLVTGMLCRLCQRHKTKNKYNHSPVWSSTPCISFRKDALGRHANSDQHKSAVELESHRVAAERDGGIAQAFQLQVTIQHKAVKGAMQCLYWLVKSEVSHTTKYGSLVDAVQYMGCDYFKHLNQAENAKYKSQRIISEFLQVIATQLEEKQLQKALSSDYFSLLIDETTDVAVINEMVIYARYMHNGSVATTFLKICELFDGTANTIESSLQEFMTDKGLPISKMVGLGTDGASVMVGRHNGVAARFKQRQPLLTSIHCICHRLALAAAQAGNDIAYIRDKFKPTLSQLFHFYHNSSVRMSGLQAIEKLLETPELKLKKPADTRWLSHDSACQTLVKVFPAVCASLSREAEERGDALAVGLHNVVRKYNFIASLYMMCDILPTVTRLSCTLQGSCIDVSQLHLLVTSTIEALELLCTSKGPRSNTLDFDLQNSLASCEVTVTPELKHQFDTRVYTPFIKALITHIKERLPDTGIFSAFSVLDPSKLPSTAEEAVSLGYGDSHVQTLEKQYGQGDHAVVDNLKAEWSDLRLYLYVHCRNLSMADILKMLTTDTTLLLAYPNFVKLAQVSHSANKYSRL